MDRFVVFSIIVIMLLIPLVFYTFNLYFRVKMIEYAIIASFFLFSAITYSFILLAYSYDLLIFYQLERIFLISSYWFLLSLITKVRKQDRFYKVFVRILFFFSTILIGLVLLWDKGQQPDKAMIFGTVIGSIENVPYHPKGASVRIERIDLIYGTSFPLLNTIYMILITTLLLYTFITLELHVKTERTRKAKLLWISSLGSHLAWTIFALPWLDLGRQFQFLNIITAVLLVIVTLFYPEGLILSKSQIMASYHFYDKIVRLGNLSEKSSNISDMAVDYIIEYINSMPAELLDKSKNLDNTSS